MKKKLFLIIGSTIALIIISFSEDQKVTGLCFCLIIAGLVIFIYQKIFKRWQPVGRMHPGVKKCGVCHSKQLSFVKKQNAKEISWKNFTISNSDYGVTGDLWRCDKCGFIQCLNIENVQHFYEVLEDPDYEAGRLQRLIQAEKVLEKIGKHSSGDRLLDVGAGSGILVEAALKMGYKNACGIEPSKWLAAKARQRDLPVFQGTLPNDSIENTFDVIVLQDVIEHVENPSDLIKQASLYLSDNGLLVVETPDVDSFLSILMGSKWWHFRVAHIGYFNSGILDRLLNRHNLSCIAAYRPGWYFTLDYIIKRLNVYLPKILQLPQFAFFNRITIPLYLFDSMLRIYSKKGR